MIYQSFSGDAQGSTGTWTQTGGSLSAAEGPLFHVTNATGVITLHSVNTSATSGVLLKAASNKWGTSSANGGKATLVAIAQKLSGSVIVDKISTATLKLTNGSAWTGAIDTAHTAKSVAVSLDSNQHMDGDRDLVPHVTDRGEGLRVKGEEHRRQRPHRLLRPGCHGTRAPHATRRWPTSATWPG